MTKKDDYSLISKINYYIYLGPADHPIDNSEQFQKLGINVVINCAKEIEYPLDTKFEWKLYNFPIIDGDYVTFVENMDAVADRIYQALKKKQKIYIHCAVGVSRSPALLVYFFMIKKNLKYYDIVRSLTKRRRCININEEFADALLSIDDN